MSAPPPYRVVFKLEFVEEGADDAWLEKNPGYDGAHAAIFAPIFWYPGDPKTAIIRFGGLDGRTGKAPDAKLIQQVWRALALHLSERSDVPEIERALYRRVEQMVNAEGRKERRKKERAARGNILTDEQYADVIERLKPLCAEAIARANSLHVPVAEYCVMLQLEPSPGSPDGIVVTRDEARRLIPPERDTYGVVPELEEPRAANLMLAFVAFEGGVEVVRVELTSLQGEGQPLN